MTPTREFFVTFWAPGSFFGESWRKPAETDDPAAVAWPDNAYAFTMHRRDVVVTDGRRFEEKPVQIGPTYYHPDSKIETLDEVRVNPSAGATLVSNMECNKWDRVVWSRWGNWPQPWDAEKCVILPKVPA